MDGAVPADDGAGAVLPGKGADEEWRTINLWHASSGDVYGGWLLVCTLRNSNALLAFNVSEALDTPVLLWTLASPNGLESDFTTVDGEIAFYMPHAVQIYSETEFAFIDDGGVSLLNGAPSLMRPRGLRALAASPVRLSWSCTLSRRSPRCHAWEPHSWICSQATRHTQTLTFCCATCLACHCSGTRRSSTEAWKSPSKGPRGPRAAPRSVSFALNMAPNRC